MTLVMKCSIGHCDGLTADWRIAEGKYASDQTFAYACSVDLGDALTDLKAAGVTEVWVTPWPAPPEEEKSE